MKKVFNKPVLVLISGTEMVAGFGKSYCYGGESK